MTNLYDVENCQFLLSDGPDAINSCLRSGTLWESHVLDILKAFCAQQPYPVLVDIGANLGAISIPIGQHIRHKGGMVYAIEAQRNVFYQLCGNIFANDLAQYCHAYHCAVSNAEGSVSLPILDSHNEHNIGSLSIDPEIRKEQQTLSSVITEFEDVTVTTIDNLNLPHATLVKIDVEGLEYEVITGAHNWIVQSNYPPLIFEVWGDYMKQQKTKKQQLFDYLQGVLGYTVTVIGELGIAQHANNTFFNINVSDTTIQLSPAS